MLRSLWSSPCPTPPARLRSQQRMPTSIARANAYLLEARFSLEDISLATPSVTSGSYSAPRIAAAAADELSLAAA